MRRGKNQDLNKRSRSADSWSSPDADPKKPQAGTYRWGRRKGQPKPHPRLRQRALEVRRRPWRVVAVLAVVLALVAGVVYLFGFSTVFEVEEVTVAGADGEVADGAREAAEANLGRPLARVSTDALESRVLEDLRVATAEVGRDWPSGLTVDLTLREPALAIDQSSTEGIQLVDAEGVIYDTVEKAPKGVPTARVLTSGDARPAPAQLVALQGLTEVLPGAVAEQADDLTLTRQGEIKFTVGNIEVVWGDGSNAQLKGRVLEGLLAQEGLDPEAEVPATGPMVIDVATPTTPVVTGLKLEEPTG